MRYQGKMFLAGAIAGNDVSGRLSTVARARTRQERKSLLLPKKLSDKIKFREPRRTDQARLAEIG